MSFTKIRFTCSVYRPKNNYGTSMCNIEDINNQSVFLLNGGNNYVCPTSGSKEFEINIPFNFAFKITLKRYIDTRSDGNSTMKIELFDSILNKWVIVLNTSRYRTGNGWETVTYNLNASAYIVTNTNMKIPFNFYKNGITDIFYLSPLKMTDPAIKFEKGNEILYGNLVPFKPLVPRLSALINGKTYFLSNDISNFKWKFNKNYLQPAWIIERGEVSTDWCKNCKIIFNSRGQSYGSHKGNNGTHYGTLSINIINKKNESIFQNGITLWNYLGGDSTHNANISNREILNVTFDEPIKVILKWNLDLGGYKAHIWGSRHYITAVASINMNIECA